MFKIFKWKKKKSVIFNKVSQKLDTQELEIIKQSVNLLTDLMMFKYSYILNTELFIKEYTGATISDNELRKLKEKFQNDVLMSTSPEFGKSLLLFFGTQNALILYINQFFIKKIHEYQAKLLMNSPDSGMESREAREYKDIIQNLTNPISNSFNSSGSSNTANTSNTVNIGGMNK